MTLSRRAGFEFASIDEQEKGRSVRPAFFRTATFLRKRKRATPATKTSPISKPTVPPGMALDVEVVRGEEGFSCGIFALPDDDGGNVANPISGNHQCSNCKS